MSRWRVRYRPGRDSWTNIWGETTEFEQRPWLVEKIGRGGKPRRFDVWTEALAYADRMARTVEVELPRVGERTAIPQREDMGMGINWSILAEWDDYDPSQLMISGPYGQMYIYAQDIKKTALALLAMARKEQQ